LSDARSIEEWTARFEAAITESPEPGPLQQALVWMQQQNGCVSMDDLAGRAGLSPRQLRRVCLEQTGLTPKFLARVTRFRHALAEAHRYPGAFAGFAVDCGYYDQAHLINEFRELYGRTPTELST
jgi:transcriptional regulator GlxA family with amidase domain